MNLDFNIKAAELLLKLEIGLREFIIESFDKFYENDQWNKLKNSQGPLTFKSSQKVESMIDYIARNKAAEIKKGWANSEIHDLYFLAFGHLKQILVIERNFEKFNLSRNKIKIIALQIEFITSLRNKVAHARIINKDEYKTIKSAYDQMDSLIKFDNYVSCQIKEMESKSSEKLKKENTFKVEKILAKIDRNNKISDTEMILISTLIKNNKIISELKLFNKIIGLQNSFLKINNWKKKNDYLIEKLKYFLILK